MQQMLDEKGILFLSAIARSEIKAQNDSIHCLKRAKETRFFKYWQDGLALGWRPHLRRS